MDLPKTAMPNMKLPRRVRPVLAALVPGVQVALGDNCVGIYIRGSLATGDFRSTSDIDTLVATERAVSDAEFDALTKLHGESGRFRIGTASVKVIS